MITTLNEMIDYIVGPAPPGYEYLSYVAALVFGLIMFRVCIGLLSLVAKGR